MSGFKLYQLTTSSFDNREREPQFVGFVRAYLGQAIISKFNFHAESI